MPALREVGIAAQTDLLKACPAAQGDRPVEVGGGLLVAGPVAAAIDHAQRLARVGQRKDQRMITPLALVIDVHALLALAGGLHHRAVGVDDGFLEERLGLLPPDLQPRGVEDRLQAEDGGRIEAAAEVARRGRVGDAAGTQGVEVRFVVAQQFQVFQAGPPASRL